MRSAEDVRRVLELRADGRSALAISQLTGIPRSTVRDWTGGRLPGRSESEAGQDCPRCRAPAHDYSALPPSYVYLLGLYLGDGCISSHPRSVYRLRVFLDLRYPDIVRDCERAMRDVFPANRIGHQGRTSNYIESDEDSNVEVSVYSRRLPCLFPQHGPGRKHNRVIELSDWQLRLVRRHAEQLLRGLVHSDGCRFMNSGRNGWRAPRYSFHNLSEDIKAIFCHACDLLDLHWTLSGRMTIYVSKQADVARMDRFIGPKT